MSDGRMKQLTWVGILTINTLIWYSIWNYGLLITLLPVVGITCIGGLIIKLKEHISSMNDIFRGE